MVREGWGWERRGEFVAYANFPGVNTPTTVNFKLPKWDQQAHKNFEIETVHSYEPAWASSSPLPVPPQRFVTQAGKIDQRSGN